MILRLQREKVEIQMEARQFKRFVEEKMAHDQQEFLLAVDDRDRDLDAEGDGMVTRGVGDGGDVVLELKYNLSLLIF